ncbi:MAG: hypothetical protein QOG45_1761 [Chloroflexota bacterium]|nr:hypothetical protein [Chloroflexota bacterium]
MSKTDEDLREPIERELKMEPGLDAAAVAVKDGTVTCQERSPRTPRGGCACVTRPGWWPRCSEARRVRGGLEHVAASMGPSAALALTTVCNSSMTRMILPSLSVTSRSTAFSRSRTASRTP